MKKTVKLQALLLILLILLFTGCTSAPYADEHIPPATQGSGTSNVITTAESTEQVDTVWESFADTQADTEWMYPVNADTDTCTEPYVTDTEQILPDDTHILADTEAPDTSYATDTAVYTPPTVHTETQAQSSVSVTDAHTGSTVTSFYETTADAYTEKITEEITVYTSENDDEPSPRIIPDYVAMAKRDFEARIYDAAAYVTASPFGDSFVTYPYEKHNARESLNEDAKILYDDMLAHAAVYEPVTYSFSDGYKAEDITAAADALILDELEIRCYFGIVEAGDGEEFSVVYRLPSDGNDVTYEDKTALADEMEYLRAVGELVVSSMPKDITTYDRYRYLASFISLSTEYDMDFIHNFNNDTPYGALAGGLTICRGYAYSFEYLCSLADLYCGRVEGMSFANNAHMWNVIKLESGTYHVDVTWSDSGSNKPCDSRWMKYFAKTQSEILTDHIISDGTVTSGE